MAPACSWKVTSSDPSWAVFLVGRGVGVGSGSYMTHAYANSNASQRVNTVFIHREAFESIVQDGTTATTTATSTKYAFGTTGDIPVVGDWVADGVKRMGTFNAGVWRLDYNGNGGWDGAM